MKVQTAILAALVASVASAAAKKPKCFVTGCNNDICSDSSVPTDCFAPADPYVSSCYASQVCRYNSFLGSCVWKHSFAIDECLETVGKACDAKTRIPNGYRCKESKVIRNLPCQKSGCGGELCVDPSDPSGGFSVCVFQPYYACYQNATCARQDDGECAWTDSESLSSCVASFTS